LTASKNSQKEGCTLKNAVTDTCSQKRLAKPAQHRLHRTSAGFAHTWGDSAPKTGSPFGFYLPNPALAGKTCRSAASPKRR